MIRAVTFALVLVTVVPPALAQGGRRGADLAPARGAPAPDFELHRLTDEGTESEDTVTLSELCQDKPVALVFGSYT
jgi:hypothetical protein